MIQAPASKSSTHNADGSPRETVVQVQHLSKVFRDFWMRARVKAVDDVSFEIYRGEVFGLLGPNGSGKSTSIKVLLGLLHKTSGRVSVFGRPPSDVSIKKRIGYLPEESYLYQFLNARETLDYYAKLFGLDRAVRERRIDELLDMVGLTGVQFRPVREYSKGMQRRIGIAQALINDPELLILDEPTTGLDPIGTRQIKDLIIELGRRGKTIILSSHLLSDVEDCVDRMVILYGGKVQSAGTCDELLEAHDRTTIESSVLDDATIAEIDRIIRARSGGANAISRVSKPRQRLEDLFIGIVERARAAKLETAGAQHGGQTAAFLRGEETGDAVISRLLTAEEAPVAPAIPLAEQLKVAGPDKDLIGSLTSAKNDQPAQKPGAATPKPVKQEVDQSVIGSLLGGEPGKGDSKPGSNQLGSNQPGSGKTKP